MGRAVEVPQEEDGCKDVFQIEGAYVEDCTWSQSCKKEYLRPPLRSCTLAPRPPGPAEVLAELLAHSPSLAPGGALGLVLPLAGWPVRMHTLQALRHAVRPALPQPLTGALPEHNGGRVPE